MGAAEKPRLWLKLKAQSGSAEEQILTELRERHLNTILNVDPLQDDLTENEEWVIRACFAYIKNRFTREIAEECVKWL